MDEIVKNIDKYYNYARIIGGDLSHDIVHHVIMELPSNIRKPDAYMKTCIRNAYYNKKSTFNKLYRPNYTEEIEDIEDVKINSVNYDAMLLHRIFLELENEGYGMQVQVYKDCTLVSSISKFSRNSNINPRTINKICKFVHNEIIRRYTELDLD